MFETRHRSHKKPSRFRAFLSRYRFEIIWFAVVALGVFLVFERLHIRRNVLRWLGVAVAAVLDGIGHVDEAVAAFVARTTFSDAVGYVLISGRPGGRYCCACAGA